MREKKEIKPKKRQASVKAEKPAVNLRTKARVIKKEEGALRVLGLDILKPAKGAHKKRKLLGRGPSSGHGKTSTRGSKGQTSRAGRDFYLGFEGGQTPMIRRFPKRGFNNVNRKVYQIVNLRSLSGLNTAEITPEVLEQNGLIKNKDKLIKILGVGSVSLKLNVKAHAFSRKAQEDIVKAGGTTEVIKIK